MCATDEPLATARGYLVLRLPTRTRRRPTGCLGFIGFVTDEELIRRPSSCSVGVNPDPLNPFNDASSMSKILEYMALGPPVVQFDLKEGRHSAGDTGAHAIPTDERDLARTILEALDDDVARERMSREGMRRMKEGLEWAPLGSQAAGGLRLHEGPGRDGRLISWHPVLRSQQ